MDSIFTFKAGTSPLLVSMPHSGTSLPADTFLRLSEEGKALTDTDWYIERLYNFLDDMDISIIRANYSRYVVDLNRPSDGSALYPGMSETEICPTTSFTGQALYRDKCSISSAEKAERIEKYWQPYHQKLALELERIKAEFGYALLWDAHSIQSEVPRFFEGRLPDLNIGTVNGNSCDPRFAAKLASIAEQSSNYSAVLNGRFKGGFITRNYGNPSDNIHAMQLEIAQVSYMNEFPTFTFEEQKASRLRPTLRNMIATCLDFDFT